MTRQTRITWPSGALAWGSYVSIPTSVWSSSDTPQNLKRIEVIEDDESQIIEAVRRMSDSYDFVVTRYPRLHPPPLTKQY